MDSDNFYIQSSFSEDFCKILVHFKDKQLYVDLYINPDDPLFKEAVACALRQLSDMIFDRTLL